MFYPRFNDPSRNELPSERKKKEICRAHKNERYFGEFDTHGISGRHERQKNSK